jgi:hypothetical protein
MQRIEWACCCPVVRIALEQSVLLKIRLNISDFIRMEPSGEFSIRKRFCGEDRLWMAMEN